MYVIARLENPGEDEARMSSGPVNNLSFAKKKWAIKKKNAVKVPAQAPVAQILNAAEKYLNALTG